MDVPTPGEPVALVCRNFDVRAPRVTVEGVVQYELTFVCGKRKPRPYHMWFSWTALKAMHDALAKRWKKVALLDFPSRACPEFMEKRRVELLAYVTALAPLVEVPGQPPPPEWAAFVATAEAEPPLPSFVVPTLGAHGVTMIPVSCLVAAGQEVFIGPVVDALLDATKTISRIKLAFDLLGEDELERELELLDRANPKLVTASASIASNAPEVCRVEAAPHAPPQLRSYLTALLEVAESARAWATLLEASLLSSLTDDPPVNNAPVAPVADEPVKDLKGSLAELQERAERLAVDVLSAAAQSDSDFAELMAEKKALLATLLKRREKHLAAGEVASAEHCSAVVAFVEENVVAVRSHADSLRQFEARLYGLVDGRAALAAGDGSGAAQLRRAIVAFRRTLRDVKERWLHLPDQGNAALAADLNRLTDIQENASNLQLQLEQAFTMDHDLDSVRQLQRRNKALSEAEAERERVETELFEL